uniref:Formin homology 2 domain containing 3b n=1 Tax=Gadus morhua TaxID=8049 RepID=A0A8C5CH01_GADMO
MATLVCRVQFLDDTDPFNSTSFPEPSRPPQYSFREEIPLINQIAGVHRLLKAPHKLDDCALQLSHNGSYLDLDSTLAEQRDELEGFQVDGGIVLRMQLSVRVHACIEKLYNSSGRELRRALFSLKQIFQDDKDLVHEFVNAEGLTCLIKVGAEADQNYQNYILRALGQIMLYVDGMNGLITHNETVQWLYTLSGSKFRLVVKTALKLLLVFVEYTETNAALLIKAVAAVDSKRGTKLWRNATEVLEEKDGVDTELLVYTMTLLNKTLAGLPDQDSYYDMVDSLEEQGMEGVAQRHLSRRGTDLDLVEQFNIYEVSDTSHEVQDNEVLGEAKEEVGGSDPMGAQQQQHEEEEVGLEEKQEKESILLSEKERQNEEVNEKDNCSASSISSASSTLEREEREERVTRDIEAGPWSARLTDSNVNEQSSGILNKKRFMLDMLFSQSPEGLRRVEVGPLENQGSVRATAERFGDLVKGLMSPPEADTPSREQAPPPAAGAPPPPPKKESDYIWDQLMAVPRELRIKEMDFTDLGEEDDQDILDLDGVMGSGSLSAPPPPPPPPQYPCNSAPPAPPLPHGCPPPPPLQTPTSGPGRAGEAPLFQKKKKTIRLFWNEVRPADRQFQSHSSCRESLWSKLDPVKLDTSKLEQLFESKSKDLPKAAVDGKRQEIIVLDSKRSNAINIGLTVLPPPRTIKTAILNFDEYALNKEGIEKILTMTPSEEEKQRIQEAQLGNPEVPLGSAEQFLLTLSSITELSARLQLWAFKMDYEVIEKEVAEPLQDLKEGMDQLEKNKTLRCILGTLLSIGNFLNGTNAKGFELSYLEKVPEVKDTVHKQSLLHHVCSIVVDKFPESSDLYSEIGAITRSAKVDFDQLQDNLVQMERRCKASWDHLKVIAKHEMKPALKQKMSDFLKDCAERIIILMIVHRRIVNRFHAFLLFLGHPTYAIRKVSIHRFSKILSEFALEYRTTRERVLQQRQKRANHRERNKTRGKMITDVSRGTGSTANGTKWSSSTNMKNQ